MTAILKRGLIGVVIVYCLILVVMYVYQSSLIFFPKKLTTEALGAVQAQTGVEYVTLNTKDNCNLRGWFVNSKMYKKPGLLIYFGGNAEEVSWLIEDMKKINGWNVVLMNYRGYGQSEGIPGETELFSDSLEIYDYFLAKEKPDQIVVMGRSLGTGVATYVAAKRKVSGVILVSPYDSITSVAKENYPYLPVELLLKHKFDSLSRANSIKAPLKVIIAANDTTIPPKNSKTLANNWGGKAEVSLITNEDHNTVSLNDKYWKIIGEFLASLRG